jgi:hypothetical protein
MLLYYEIFQNCKIGSAVGPYNLTDFLGVDKFIIIIGLLRE